MLEFGSESSKTELFIRITETPNPNAKKFVVNRDLKSEGKVTYSRLGECTHVPLAMAILSIPGVTQIHFFENVLTVTQDGMADWKKVENAVESILSDSLEDHDPAFDDFLDDKKKPSQDLTGEIKRIDEILEETIRPSLQADGGDLELVSYDEQEKILSVSYLGACGGCPSSMYGTLEAIRGVLRSYFDEDIEVVVI